MNFRQYLLQEAIIDTLRKNYSKDIFDDYNTASPKLKFEIKDIIEKQVREFENYFPVIDYKLIGSILTKRYRKDADLDINILFDIPDDEKEEKLEKLKKLLNSINGRLVPGTEHPINYFLIVDPKVHDRHLTMADNIYDIKTNRFIKKSIEGTFNLKNYLDKFRDIVYKIDLKKGELKRNLVDYDELKNLSAEDVEGLEIQIEKKLEEIESNIKHLIDIKGSITVNRKLAFIRDMTPEEIVSLGTRNKLPENVIYKLLEKYHYLIFIKKLKEILGNDADLSHKEADKLVSNHGNT